MALETVFTHMCVALQKLQDALVSLRITIVEDRPLSGEILLTEELGANVDDLLGWLEGAQQAAFKARSALQPPFQMDVARISLTECQNAINEIQRRFSLEMISYESISRLNRLGRERGREWGEWVRGVRQGMHPCRELLYEVIQASFQCWQDITESLDLKSGSITSIGQQITIPNGQALAQGGVA